MDSTPLMADETAAKPHPETHTQSVRSGSPVVSDHDAKEETAALQHEGYEEEKASHSTRLGRSSWALFVVVPFAAVVLLAWSIICVQTVRPITTESYQHFKWTGTYDIASMRAAYDTNEKWFRACRVLLSIVGVLTIPITSAVCSKAAVVFAQAPRGAGLSLRQTMALADHGWADPAVYYRLLTSGFRRYATSLLLLAIMLNILGGLISPLQSIYLTTGTTKTPYGVKVLAARPDLYDKLSRSSDSINYVSIATRSAITSTLATTSQSHLWTRGETQCQQTDLLCYASESALTNMSSLQDPFFAPMPNGTNTGLITQFLPRINSSVTRENITEAEFPTDCNARDGAFFAHFFHDGQFNSTNFGGNWSLTACMPANQTASPWRVTRDRQDISEQMYLKLTSDSFEAGRYPLVGMYRFTVNTTLGYFELPNYGNGLTPGPLLDKDPWNSSSIETQIPPVTGLYRRGVEQYIPGLSNSSVILEAMGNKGPLLAIAMALFGENSFIANRFQHPESFVTNLTNTHMWDDIDSGTNQYLFDSTCTEQAPLMGLFNTDGMTQLSMPLYPGCITGKQNQLDTIQRQVDTWLVALGRTYSEAQVINAFTAAAFLANEVWLTDTTGGAVMDMFVSADMGADTQLPVISHEGIIVISILLGIYLAGLLAMALYASHRPTWTSSLDAFAMLRIGAAIADELPFRYARNSRLVQVLDHTPGYIGEAEDGHADVGKLALGSSRALSMRALESYEDSGPEWQFWRRRGRQKPVGQDSKSVELGR